MIPSSPGDIIPPNGFDTLTLVGVFVAITLVFVWSLRNVVNTLVFHDVDNEFDD